MSYTAEAYYTHEHGEAPIILQSASDVDQLIDALLSGSAFDTVAALYVQQRPRLTDNGPDHELRIGVSPQHAVGSIRYTDDSRSWYVAGKPTTRREGVVYSHMGNPEQFPADAEVDLDTVRAVAKEFLASGGDRASDVEWREWPEGL